MLANRLQASLAGEDRGQGESNDRRCEEGQDRVDDGHIYAWTADL